MSIRWLYGLGFMACAALIGIAVYFQYVMDLEPCPLCLIQRIIILIMGLILLLGFLHNPKVLAQRIYGGSVALAAGIGAAISARHVWLQNLPEGDVPECGPGLEYILSAFPLRKALDVILRGSGECHEVVWSFLGLTIPGWTLIIFIVFMLVGLWQLFSPRRSY